jgi:hypothetical protein
MTYDADANMYAVQSHQTLWAPTRGPHATSTHATRPPSNDAAHASSAEMAAIGSAYKRAPRNTARNAYLKTTV